MQVGAQLFTLREYCKTLEDFSETLEKVADMGMKTVQVSGVCEFEPQWLKEKLDQLDLKCVLTHVRPPESFYENTAQVIKDHNVFDCKYLGLGSFDFKEQPRKQYEQFLELYRPVTKQLKDGGKYFMYHNHSMEFVKIDGKIILEKMAEDFPADELGFTLDVCWAQTGGADPAYWLEQLKGRVPCIHMKDRDHIGNFVPLGEGNLNLTRVLEKAAVSNVDYLLLEQDNCNGEDEFDCMRRSYEYLKAFGFR